jgi:GTP cyclohydrolase IV
MVKLPDVQALVPDTRFKLSRVGVSDVRKLVRVRRPHSKDDIVLTVRFDIAVDLPPTMKGSHMSRNVEAVAEILDRSTREPVAGLETLCLQIAKEVLKRHEYATEAEVKAEADYFLDRKTPFNTVSTEWYKLIAEALATSDGKAHKLVGIEATGMSACPCAMETAKTLRGEDGSGPGMTHNQRNRATLLLEVPERITIEADRLVDLVEGAQSTPTYELLKRKSEAQLVLNAHDNPKFVEDVVRGILHNVIEAYPDLPAETIVYARSISEESIHKHDAYAVRETTIGELRQRPH